MSWNGWNRTWCKENVAIDWRKKGEIRGIEPRKDVTICYIYNYPYSESRGIDPRKTRESVNVVVLIVLTESYWKPCICWICP